MIRKINALNKLFQALDKDINRFKTKYELKCPERCGICCLKKDIEASVLEFLPAAYYLFINEKSDEFLNKLNSENSDSICIFYNPFLQDNGLCSIYPYRGMICRLFGFAANYDKNGIPQLVTCKIIKETPGYSALKHTILNPPIISDYYTKLANIDFLLTYKKLPINGAIKKALEMVLFYHQFKPKRKAS